MVIMVYDTWVLEENVKKNGLSKVGQNSAAHGAVGQNKARIQ